LVVTVVPADAGTVTVEPEGAAYPDSTVTFIATPAAGYVFAGWEGDLSGTENPASLLMDGPKAVTARFTTISVITVESDPSRLPCIVDGADYTTPVVFDWSEGSIHSLSVDSLILRNEGFRLSFTGWNGHTGRVRTITVGPSDEMWTARFEQQFRLTVAVEPPQAGTVSGVPADPWSSSGASVQLRALPGPGSAFLGWAGDASGNTNPLDFLMNGAKTITARFGNKPPIVTAPDTSFAEDGTLILADPRIRTWVSDENDSPESIVFRFFPGPALVVDTVAVGLRIRTTVPDWNGNEILIVSATDPSGGEGRDTLTVTVTPVPDPPSAFALLSPPTDLVLAEKPDTLRFEWEPASDPDGDPIVYTFTLDTSAAFSGSQQLVCPGLTEPGIVMPWTMTGWGKGTYHWTVSASDGTGLETACANNFSFSLDYIEAPASFVLMQNFPNPFNAGTKVEFGLPTAGRAKVQVFDIRGRLVRTLADGSFTEGFVSVHWDGSDDDGRRLASGLYVIRMTAGRFHATRKAVLLP
ncbi:T9SS type A sorting domain-containing protein, partial [bacterium]|nr:T9SS type A sorting domain-containing protein [bacterium]